MEFDAARINSIINDIPHRQSIGKSYANAEGFLKPPKKMTDAMREEIRKIEAEAESILMRQQGYVPDAEYLDLGKIRNADLRRSFLDRIANVYGFRGALNEQGVGYVVSAGQRPYYVDRLDPTQEVDEVGIWFEQHVKQFAPENITVGTATREAITLPGRQMRLSAIERVTRQRRGEVPFPSSYAVLDIETTGLEGTKNDIWQVAIRGSDDRTKNMYFQANMPGTTAAGPLSRTVYPEGLDPADIRPIDDIVEAIDMLEDYDAVVAQNVGFDLGFMIKNLKSIGRQDLADRISAKYVTEGGGYGDNVFDTLRLGRALPMTMAPELEVMVKNRVGRGSPYSLENVLLESNLMELMTDPDSGYGYSPEDIYLRLQDRKLHDAYIDTMFERAYFQELEKLQTGEGQLRPQAGGSRLAGITDAENLEIRRMLLEGGAATPYTQMGYDQVAPEVMEALEKSRYSEQYIKRLNLSAVGGDVPFVTLNPMEHSMIQARLLGPKAVASLDTDAPSILRAIGALNKFDDMVDPTAPFVMPDMKQYEAFMETLAKAQVPYANLSAVERLASMGMAAQVPGEVSEQVGDVFSRMFLTSQMQGGPQAKVFKSGRVYMPLDLLKLAEEEGVFGKGDLQRTRLGADEEIFRLSPFEFPTRSGTIKDVSANLLLSPIEAEAQAEYARLQTFIEDFVAQDPELRSQYGVGEDFVREFKNLNFASFEKYGIQVGSMARDATGRFAHVETARQAYDTIKALGGVSVDATDGNQIAFSAGLAAPPNSEEGTMRLGAVVSGTALEGEDLDNYFANARMASTLADNLTRDVPTDPALRTVIGNKKFQEGAEKIADWHVKMSSIYKGNKTAIRGAVAATAITAGYYMYKRREDKRSYFTDPFEQQAIEEEGWYERYQTEMGGGMAAQYNTGSRDPLATAGVVGTLDRQKIGHTRMGSDKNSHLFGTG